MHKTIFLLLILTMVLPACQTLDSGLPDDRMISGPIVVLSAETHGLIDALFIFNETSDDTYFISRYDPAADSLLWDLRVPATDSLFSYDVHLQVNPSFLALHAGDVVMVLDSQTGEKLWHKTGLGEICASCFLLGTDRVFLLDSSGSLSAWDVENGAVLWELALNESDSPNLALDAVLDVLIVLDEESSEGSAQGVLKVVRQATGEIVGSLTGACPDAEGFFDATPFKYFDSYKVQKDGTAILLMENIRQPCISYQSIPEGSEVFMSLLPEDFSLPFFAPASTLLATGSGLFIGSEANDETCSLLQIDLTGQVESVIEEPACEVLDPVFWSQPVLYYTTLSEDGDARLLHAYDVESGQILWAVPLDYSESLVDEGEISFWQHDGKLEFYYTFEEDSINYLAFQVMDPVSGDVNIDLVITPLGQTPWELYPVQSPEGFYYVSENSLVFYDVRLRQEQVLWPAYYLSN
jgi:outer membrane protein assembly factor BamB